MLWRPRVPAEPARQVSALQFLGAVLLPDLSGWWVYALGDVADGHVFYAGQSDHLISRLRDHSYSYRAQFDPARVYLVRVADQAQADLYELMLIERYAPECNSVGRREELAKRCRAQNKPGWARQPRLADSIDSSQATG
jgi:hypothetical protein